MYYQNRFLINSKKAMVLAFFVQISFLLFGQSAPMEFGKVPVADLNMTVYEQDTAAVAVVLGDFARITVELNGGSYQCRFFRHRRLKILKQAGIDEYGDVFLPYYSHQKSQQMGRVKANSFSPDGQMFSLDKKDFFEEALTDKHTAVKFAFPNLQVGSVIEYEYTVMHDNVTVLPEWYFQEDIPVRLNELQFSFPVTFAYTYLFEGNRDMIKREEDGVTYLEGESGQMILKERNFIMKNAVAMKPEPHITTMDDYKARIRFQLDAYMDGYGVKRQVLSSWSEIVKDLENNAFFGLQYGRKRTTKKMNDELQPLLNGATSEKEKAKIIYQFIADNMVWDGYYRDFASRDLNESWEKKQGSSADLNFMLLALLQQNGFEAHPLMTSTRSNGKMYEDYPMLHQFDHTMVYVKIDGKEFVMDVPLKTRPFDIPTIDALNGRGVVIKSPEAVWVDIPSPMGSDAFMFDIALDDAGNLSGIMEGKYNGYNANPERRAYLENKEGTHWQKRFEEFSTANVEVVELENLEDIYEPFKEKINIEIPEAAQVAGDFIYFSPVLHSPFKENIFKLKKRYFPVDIAYPIQEQMMIKLKIPEGYAVEEIPEPINLALANNAGKFRFVVEKKDDQNLQIVSVFRLSQRWFEPNEYGSLRELFDLVAEKYGEQIVLKKL